MTRAAGDGRQETAIPQVVVLAQEYALAPGAAHAT
jgi:hypothetical protein